MIGATVLWFVASRTRAESQSRNCASNVREIGSALVMYTFDHNGSFPPYTNIESDLSRKQGSSSTPTASNEPQFLRDCLRLYTDEGYWFCPSDPVAAQPVYYLGIRHQFTSYAIPAYFGKSGQPMTLNQLPNSISYGLVWDAAGDRNSCQPGVWYGGSRDWASNHPDGSVNFVLGDLSLHHTEAQTKEGKILP